jgi:hypothetical protein
MIPVKPSQLRGILARNIKAHYPVCVVGASGIGKSDIVASAAWDAGVHPSNFLILHPVTSDPTDYKGLPVMTINGAEFSAYGDLRRMMGATELLVVFLDDLGQASTAVQAALMQLVLARQCNGQRISDHVVFVAATNRREDRAGVTGMLDTLKKRFLMLLLVPDLGEWQTWAAGNGVSPKVIAYLSLKPEYFHVDEPTPDMSVNPYPRGWHRVSNQLVLDHPLDVLPQVFAGCVGREAGAGFAGFLRVFDNLVMPEVVFANPDTAPIPSEPSALWALCSALAYRVTPQTVGACCRYLKRLVDKKREYAMLSVKLMVSRDPALQTGKDFIDAMTGPLGRLMMGGKV